MTATLKQLEAFVAVARTGSFSAAARMVHVSQPALTAVIKKLEEQLGITLFERTSRGVAITTAAREMLPTIERLLGELNDTLANVLSGTAPRGGTVTIACIPSVAGLYLPPLISEFSRTHQDIAIRVRDAMPENRGILTMVRAGEVDLGLATPLEEAADLQFRHLYDDELVALLPADHPACRQGQMTWRELAGLPLIGMAYQSVVRLLIDRAFAGIGVARRPVAEVSLITTAIGMARAGIGAAVLPWTAAKLCDLSGLRTITLVEPIVRRPMGLLYRSIAELSPAAKAFFRFASSRKDTREENRFVHSR